MAGVSGTKKPSRPPAAPQRKFASSEKNVLNEEAELSRIGHLKNRVKVQTWVIAGLTALLLLILPFAQPVYIYYAKKPDNAVMQMVGLAMPNMNNRAVLSWMTTTVTEIMTLGFGDVSVKLPQQRKYFTKAGWRVYMQEFSRLKIAETLKQSQLVMTTVPSNTPVVVDQGINPDQIYQGTVQMPIIMTYATNNNVTVEKRAIVTATIIRVASEDNPAGIAVQQWSMGAK